MSHREIDEAKPGEFAETAMVLLMASVGALSAAPLASCGDVASGGPDGGAPSRVDGAAAETGPDAAPSAPDTGVSTPDPDGAPPTADARVGDGGAPVACDDGWTGPACEQCTVYVDAGSGDDAADGLSWSRAKATVEAGMELADARQIAGGLDDCAVWIAAGTYAPGTERTDSYQLLSDVHLYGGFGGGEDALAERDVAANETVLNGDLAGDDPASTSDNAYHVLLGADGAVLDGVSVTGGVADADGSPDDDGAGMYNDATSPTIRNVTFSGNVAGGSGGALYNAGGKPVLTNVTFKDNNASAAGGAIYNYEGDPVLTDVIFDGNRGSSGGGLYNRGGAFALTNVTFDGNAAGYYGGALSVYQGHRGGTLTNVLFVGNEAAYGGAFEIREGAPVILTNATLHDNLASESSGAVRVNSSGFGVATLRIRNSIFWENRANSGADEIGGSGDVSIRHSIVQGGKPRWVGDADWIESIGDDPLFVEPPESLQLLEKSPAVDTGNSELADLPDIDIAGNPRIADGNGEGGAAIDRGAFERQP